MKKFLFTFLILTFSLILNGSGYKGTLPVLNIKETLDIQDTVDKTPTNDILPLDKLTIPVSATAKIDTEMVNYTDEIIDIIRQLERIKEVLDTDKSFKNFVAAANILNLSSENVLNKFDNERFAHSNKILADINFDTQQIKNYWIKVNKNAPYTSAYKTDNVFTGAVLNEQLNNFSKVLAYAIRELKSDFKIE